MTKNNLIIFVDLFLLAFGLVFFLSLDTNRDIETVKIAMYFGIFIGAFSTLVIGNLFFAIRKIWHQKKSVL